jgi:hypothetical protein
MSARFLAPTRLLARSKLEFTFEKSFDAAGQGAAAFNRKIIDIARRNLRGRKVSKDLVEDKNLDIRFGRAR